MIQVKVKNAGDVILNNDFYLDINDKMTVDLYRILITFTSQFTNKSKTFLANTDYTNKERYIKLGLFTTRDIAQEDLSLSRIQLGTTDFPLGFYDAILYQNTDNTNLDPTGLPVIWNGVMNLSGYSNATESVSYTEYTTNDADTESIYLTNPL
tara:strand:+ start:1493 stop:1951 length:459 start_codon:yes stop_codon:yes gene_type:complete